LRFICGRHAFGVGNAECDQKILRNVCLAVADLKARQTTRLCEIVGLVGYSLGGLPGERLLKRLGIKSSDDTVFRRVETRGRGASRPAVRVLSVDDWAWRKKQRYGTMLLDLERSQVIDLLPVRSADSLAQWLGLHPDVEMITRDRSSLYADGGRQLAPSAVQITDRAPAVATSAAAGKSERVIMQQTGHRRVDTVRRYIRDDNLFSENAAKGLGL
jgi:hypothetical protein